MAQAIEFNEYRSRNPRYFEQAPLIRALASILASFPEETQEGADGSRYITINDFSALKEQSGVVFYYHKLTQGNYLVDTTYKDYLTKAHQAGMLIGGFHFFDASVGGSDQAKYFMEQHKFIEDLTGGIFLPPMNDVEQSFGQSAKTIYNKTQAWHGVIDANIRISSLYTSPYLQSLLNPFVPTIGHVAHWTSSSSPTLPSGWNDKMTRFWQYGIFRKHSWVRTLMGVPGELDVDRFFGSMSDLKTLAGYTEPPPSGCPGECQDQIDAIRSEIAEMYSTISETGVRIDAIEEHISALENLVNKNKTDIGSLNAQADTLTSILRAIKDDILL
jgi:GH25 family lysozyme M1 (1,4-beta-N-acetylmuramidase)